jgi:hypothetical protein
MENTKLAEYWQKMAPAVLPFLIGRKVAVELNFGTITLYQRHPKEDKSKWLYISEEDVVNSWADRHAWSFHPHLRGTDSSWFVIDIDGRGENFDLMLIKDVALKVAEIFELHGVKYLVKYSGNRGFHFMWEWNMSGEDLRGKDRWEEARKVVFWLKELLEKSIAEDPDLSKLLRKVVGTGCPFTLTNSQEADCKSAILLDANILHENSNIRSPFSVHCKTGLVSVPLDGMDGLREFSKDNAQRTVVMGRDWDWVKLPVNRWDDVLGQVKP